MPKTKVVINIEAIHINSGTSTEDVLNTIKNFVEQDEESAEDHHDEHVHELVQELGRANHMFEEYKRTQQHICLPKVALSKITKCLDVVKDDRDIRTLIECLMINNSEEAIKRSKAAPEDGGFWSVEAQQIAESWADPKAQDMLHTPEEDEVEKQIIELEEARKR